MEWPNTFHRQVARHRAAFFKASLRKWMKLWKTQIIHSSNTWKSSTTFTSYSKTMEMMQQKTAFALLTSNSEQYKRQKVWCDYFQIDIALVENTKHKIRARYSSNMVNIWICSSVGRLSNANSFRWIFLNKSFALAGSALIGMAFEICFCAVTLGNRLAARKTNYNPCELLWLAASNLRRFLWWQSDWAAMHDCCLRTISFGRLNLVSVQRQS